MNDERRTLTAADILADASPDVLERLESIHAAAAAVHRREAALDDWKFPAAALKARAALRRALIAKTPIDVALGRKTR